MPAFHVPETLTRRSLVCTAGGLLISACSARRPTIEFTRVPPADKGGPDVLDVIEGRVKGAKPGQKIVVFARVVGRAAARGITYRNSGRFEMDHANSSWHRIRRRCG